MGCCPSKPKGDRIHQSLLPAPDLSSKNSSSQNQLQTGNQRSVQIENAPQANPPAQPQPSAPTANPPEQSPAQPIAQPATQPPAQTPAVTAVTQENIDEDSLFNLLLCGVGESGKTTIIRQLKIKYLGGISNEEKFSLVQTIRGNMVETMKYLIVWAEKNDREISSELEDDVAIINELDPFNCEFTVELAERLKRLWEDPAIQEAFEHRDETVITDHMDYFYPKIDELVQDDYVPSDEDVLRARVRSIGVSKITLHLQGAFICIYDVGGQANERSKWDKAVDKADGIIFCVSLSEYDKPCFENEKVLRINDALETFKGITHNPKYQQSPFFLVFNKYDMFEQKIKNTDTFVKFYPDYYGDPHDPKACQEYIKQKFIEASNPPTDYRPINVFAQSSLNGNQVSNNVNEICKYIQANYFGDD
ncbi:hypothetical protein M9Y10_019113 [Tritrichomonas musculus]|uniref:Uncharacterized protein n=1 Tax=Tritrichomonas musculus TaxID=1915356 RepID=A0ABR2HJI5_9EUKA